MDAPELHTLKIDSCYGETLDGAFSGRGEKVV